MQAIDFIYDGISLSSLGYTICEFDHSSSVRNAAADSARTFHNTSLFQGKYMPFTAVTYDDRLEMTFQIMKYDCRHPDQRTISLEEARFLKRWLCRDAPHKLKMIHEGYDSIYFEGSFNLEEIFYGSQRAGMELTFISNRPFARHEPLLCHSELLTPSDVLHIIDTSDEIGHSYPDLTVTCLTDGDLVLRNSFDNRETAVKNCRKGECLHFEENLIFSTSLDSHAVQDDFNYQWLRLSNSFHSRTNDISSSLPCSIRLSYSPIVKAVI